MGRTKSPEFLRKQLREAINNGEMVVAPGVFDAISTMLAEQAGFPAAYISGFATEGAFLGRPDMGFLTKDLMLTNAVQIAKAVDIPVICDMEQGYGSSVQLEDHIREFEAAGLAGVHLDDIIPPCKCPHIPDIPPVKIISLEEMAGKIRRAVEARRDQNFLIIGRCDVFCTVQEGDPTEAGIPKDIFGEYVRRTKAYAEAGADLMFVRGSTKEDIAELRRLINKPLLCNLNPWRQITLSELQEAGASLVTTSMPFLFVALKAMKEALDRFRQTGSMRSLGDMMLPEGDYWKLMRIEQYREIFARFNIDGCHCDPEQSEGEAISSG